MLCQLWLVACSVAARESLPEPSERVCFIQRWLQFLFCSIVLLPVLSLEVPAFGQSSPDSEQGLKPYAAIAGSNIDGTGLDNGNLNLHAPLYSLPQRGAVNLSFSLRVGGKNWSIRPIAHTPQGNTYGWYYSGGGVVVVRDQVMRHLTTTRYAPTGSTHVTMDTILTSDGSSHQVGALLDGTGETVDTTGIKLLPDGTIITRSGIRHTVGSISTNAWNPLQAEYYLDTRNSYLEDPNGNRITVTDNGWLDTLGRLIPGSPPGSDEPPTWRSEYLLPGVETSDTTGCPTGVDGTSHARVWNLPGVNASTAAIKFCYASVSVQSAFNYGNVQEGSGTPLLLSLVILPNQTFWGFSYNSFGDLATITLPWGGTISYEWSTLTACGLDGRNSRFVTARIVNANDGAGNHRWTFTYNIPLTGGGSHNTVVTDPAGNDSVHVFSIMAANQYGEGCALYETEATEYEGSQASGTLKRKTDTSYSAASNPFDGWTGNATAINVVPTQVQTTYYPSGLTSGVNTVYDPGDTFSLVATNGSVYYYSLIRNNIKHQDETDYGPGTPGSPLRQTDATYMWQSDPSGNYRAANLLDLPYSLTISDGSGHQMAKTIYGYDDPARLTGTNISMQHQPSSAPVRGNVTSVARWLNTTGCDPQTPGSCPTSYTNWYDTGEVYQSIDPRGYPTAFSYDPTFAGAYLTQTQMPDTGPLAGGPLVHHFGSAWYDFNTGLKTSITDQNGNSTNYSYDNMERLTSVMGPPDPTNGGQKAQTMYGYVDTPGYNSPYMYRQDKIDASNQTTSWVQYDGLGRVIRTAKFNGVTDVNGNPDQNLWVDDVDTCYDGLGQKIFQTYPYQGPGWLQGTYHCPPDSSTPAGDKLAYDGLGRLTTVTHADGNTVSTNYSQLARITVTDEAGNARQSQSDALGRLVAVWEPDAATGAGFPNETDYQYNALGNLLCAHQKGTDTTPDKGCNDPAVPAAWRPRVFAYDSLSRLLTATNPESGTSQYGYDPNGNLASKVLPAPNQTLGATVTTVFNYDELNRPITKSYSSGGGVVYLYDQSNLWGIPIQNGIGRLSANYNYAAIGNGDSVGFLNSYDVMGRNVYQLQFNQRIPAEVNKEFHYAYNLDGTVKSVTYPSGRVVNYSYNVGQRPVSAVDSINNINLATSAQYAAWGALTSLVNGNTAAFTGISTQITYNTRMQPATIAVMTPGAVLMSVFYGYTGCNGTAGNNGNLCTISSGLYPLQTQSFGYDHLNRLASSVAWTHNENGGGVNFQWRETYAYDSWGNLLNNNAWGGDTALNVAVNNNNQVNGWCYDAAGNVVNPNQPCANPPSSSYPNVYDGENRLTGAATLGGTTSYDYDANGQRVKKGSGNGVGTLYWYGPGGEVMEETDLSGNLLHEYVFFGDKRIARIDPANVVHYYFSDHLGSEGIVTDPNGGTEAVYNYYPFGGEYNVTDRIGNHYQFTGKERDPETGCDFFGARYYCNPIGRFLTPDPKIASLKHVLNPQKWNKYTYTLDNPLRYFDPDGMEEIEVQLRAFIPQTNAGPFKGDNRPFTTSQNVTSRTAITVRVETDPAKSQMPLLNAPKGVAGQSENLITGRKATQDTGLPTAQVSRDGNGNVVINVQQSAKLPLTPSSLTPPIRSDLNIIIPPDGSSVTTVGTVSGSPAFELNVSTEGGADVNIPLQGAPSNPVGFGVGLTEDNPILNITPLPPPPPPPPAPRKCESDFDCAE